MAIPIPTKTEIVKINKQLTGKRPAAREAEHSALTSPQLKDADLTEDL